MPGGATRVRIEDHRQTPGLFEVTTSKVPTVRAAERSTVDEHHLAPTVPESVGLTAWCDQVREGLRKHSAA